MIFLYWPCALQLCWTHLLVLVFFFSLEISWELYTDSCKWAKLYFFLLICTLFTSLSSLIALARISSILLNRNGEGSYPSLVPSLRESAHLCNMQCAASCRILVNALYQIYLVPLYSSIPEKFFLSWMSVRLHEMFFLHKLIWSIICFFIFSLLIRCITQTYFQILTSWSKSHMVMVSNSFHTLLDQIC